MGGRWAWIEDGDDNGDRRNDANSVIPRRHSPISPDEAFGAATRMEKTTRCRTEEVEPGRFVRKCETTEKTLRNCLGGSTEVLESKSEYFEDDVTEEMKGFNFPDLPSTEPFSFPGLRSDIEAIMEKSLFSDLGHMLKTAENLAEGFFRSLDEPFSRHTGKQIPVDEPIKHERGKQTNESSYSDLEGQIQDV